MWASLRRHGGGYMLGSTELAEPFFNRAGSFSCRELGSTAAWAEPIFRRSGVHPTFLVFDSCNGADDLLASGFRETDIMTTLLSIGPIGGEGGGKIVAATDPDRWTKGYLLSFYGNDNLAGVVSRIASSLLRSRAVTLMESRDGEEVVGVLALFRTPGLMGAYCVGTVPRRRGRGIATGLLTRAREIAESEERALVLQTLSSDGLLGFYLHRGFEVMYAKRFMEKKSSND